MENKDLQFSRKDLNFFYKQIENPKLSEQDIFLINCIKSHLINNGRLTGSNLARLLKVKTIDVRRLISLDRRQINKNGNTPQEFITASNTGYKLSYYWNEEHQEEIIKYFHKTQKRWKNTFNELYNLMELINSINEEKQEREAGEYARNR